VPAKHQGPSHQPSDHEWECKKLTELLTRYYATKEEGEAALGEVLNAIKGRVRSMSFDSQDGSKLVQLALEKVELAVIRELAAELRGCVDQAIRSPNANYVIQKIVGLVSMEACSFIVDELLGKGQDVAKHRYACRVLIRLLEQPGAAANPKLKKLFDELLQDRATIVKLSRHPFGNHVIRALLEQGSEEQRLCIGENLLGSFWSLGNHRHASRVIEAALEHMPVNLQDEFLLHACARPDALASLQGKRYGSYVNSSLREARAY
jgi:hypothetical protein